jgi:hypothetical protein
MQQMLNGYRGLSLLVWLNSDRLLSVGMVLLGLLAGAFLGEAVLLR